MDGLHEAIASGESNEAGSLNREQSAEQTRIELTVLNVVMRMSPARSRRLTFGQIYMELLKWQSNAPSVIECVLAVDALVREGLLISDTLLALDLSFPYAQHIIRGVTEIGAASLESNGVSSSA